MPTGPKAINHSSNWFNQIKLFLYELLTLLLCIVELATIVAENFLLRK